MNYLRILFFLFMAAAALSSAWVIADGYNFLMSPPASPGKEVIFHVAPGSTFDSVARSLAKAGLIKNTDRFRLLGRLSHRLTRIKAGDFRMNTGWGPKRVLTELTEGRSVLYRLSVREGLTWWQTAKVVERQGFGSYESFEKAIKDRALLDKYGIPGDTAEGYLFPETYMLSKPRDNDARPVVEQMLTMFQRVAKDVYGGELPPSKELNRDVILASLVEKETAAPEERERIAGVYSNRIERRMLLQCDPTIIYGIGPSFDGNIKKKHLKDKSNPYNTYRHRGLPPGPIASPGRHALAAAVSPEEHSYLYFVSKKDGTHYFSKNLKEHNRAVRKYQLRR